MSLLFPVASAPTNLMAVQEGPTSVRVSWGPPTPLGDTTGYRISYSGGSSGSVDVSDGSTDNYLLTGLHNGASYTISIMGTSQHFFSDNLEQKFTIGKIIILPHVFFLPSHLHTSFTIRNYYLTTYIMCIHPMQSWFQAS